MKLTIFCVLFVMFAAMANGQGNAATYTGTLVMFGSGFNTRMTTRTFTLRIKGETSNADALSYIDILKDQGQDKLLDAMKNEDVGSLSFGSRIAHTVNAVRISHVDGKTRIRVVLERWIGFRELRNGYRSVDYPFTYIELFVEPRTGKGEGTYIGAAKIRFKSMKDADNQIEIEDFGTFPGKLMGVTMRSTNLP